MSTISLLEMTSIIWDFLTKEKAWTPNYLLTSTGSRSQWASLVLNSICHHLPLTATCEAAGITVVVLWSRSWGHSPGRRAHSQPVGRAGGLSGVPAGAPPGSWRSAPPSPRRPGAPRPGKERPLPHSPPGAGACREDSKPLAASSRLPPPARQRSTQARVKGSNPDRSRAAPPAATPAPARARWAASRPAAPSPSLRPSPSRSPRHPSQPGSSWPPTPTNLSPQLRSHDCRHGRATAQAHGRLPTVKMAAAESSQRAPERRGRGCPALGLGAGCPCGLIGWGVSVISPDCVGCQQHSTRSFLSA